MKRPALLAVFCAFALYEVESKQDPKLIKCYNERAGGKFQQCWRDDGFETCFTKFSPDRQHVMLRGCSSRKKMFFVECENHISENRVEEFCFCSYDFCNGSSTKNSPPSHPSLLAFLSIIFHLRTLSHAPSYFSLLFTGLIFYISYSWSWLLVLVLVAGSGPGLMFHISYSCSWLNLPLASISRLAATLTNR